MTPRGLPLHDLAAFGWFAAYLATGFALLVAFSYLYKFTTPYDDQAEIDNGNFSPAICLVGAKLGFTIPLAQAAIVGANYVDFLLWAAIAAFVQLAWLKVAYMLWAKSPAEPKNNAAALRMAGGAVCIGMINAASFIP